MRPGTKLKVRTYLGDIREGVVREVNSDGSLFVEIDEQLIPDLATDIIIHNKRGKPFVIYKTKFPIWQAWIKPEWIVEEVTEKE